MSEEHEENWWDKPGGIPQDSPLRKPVNEEHARNYKEEELRRRPEHLQSMLDGSNPAPRWQIGTRGYQIMSAQEAIRTGLMKPSPEYPVDPYPEPSE